MIASTKAPTPTGIAPAQQVLLDALHTHDLMMLDAANALADADTVLPHDAPPTDWVLAVDAGLRQDDRRRLRTVALLLPRLPLLAAAVRAQQLSFDTFASVCQRARGQQLTTGQLALLDRHAAGLLGDRDGRWQADDLHVRLVDAIHAIRPDQAEQDEAAVEEGVWCQQRLYGGGDIHVTANTEHYQLVTATLARVMRDKQTLDRTKLTSNADMTDRVDAEEAWIANSKVIAQARAWALFAMCTDVLDGRDPTAAAAGPLAAGLADDDALLPDGVELSTTISAGSRQASSWPAVASSIDDHLRPPANLNDAHIGTTPAAGEGAVAVRPAMQVVVTADALAGMSDEPARMLLGGQRLTANRLRDLALTHGADVEAVVTGRDGHVVGVGRARRFAPDKLARLLTALQPTCVAPGCRTRIADVDHAEAWEDGGRTDLDNLARLCRAHHTAKHRGQFTLEPDAAGRVTIRHRSGWAATHRPPTTGSGPPSRPDAAAARSSPAPRQPRLRRTAPPRGPTDDDLPF